MSSEIPSEKNSCSVSLLIFTNGNTATDGFVGERQRHGRFGGRRGPARRDTEDMHRLGDVLDLVGPRRGIDLRWRRYDVVLLYRDDRPDESIAAARHGLDPTVATGSLAENPAQRRDLNGEAAFLDSLAGPRGFDQRVLRNQCAGPLNQCSQQRDRSPPERYGLASAQQQRVLRVQAKWSQRMDRHSSPTLTPSEKVRNFFPISSDQIHDSRPIRAQPAGLRCRETGSHYQRPPKRPIDNASRKVKSLFVKLAKAQGCPEKEIRLWRSTATLVFIVLVGLVLAIHVFPAALARRGCPAQGRA
jgi:hypothetical protein